MDQTRDSQNHFRRMALWPAHFDLNLEVSIPPKMSLLGGGNATGKSCGNQEKGEAQEQMSVSRQAPFRKGLALHGCSVKATSLWRAPQSSAGWQVVLVSYSLSSGWLHTHSATCWLSFGFSARYRLVLATNLNIFFMLIIFLRKKCLGINSQHSFSV